MSDTNPIVPPVPVAGMYPLHVARNGAVCDGTAAGSLADYYHALAGRRMKLIGSFSQRPTDCADVEALTTIWRTMYHSSPNCSDCVLSVVLAPVHDTLESSYDPAVILTSKVADITTAPATLSGTATEVTIRYDYRDEGTIYPDDYIYSERTFGLTANTTYALELATSDCARVISATVYERQRESLLSSELVVDTSSLKRGQIILDSASSDIQTSAGVLYKRGGRQMFRWSDTNDGGGISITATDYANILSSTAAAWAADTPGFWVYPGDCGNLYCSDDAVVCYAYVKSAASGSVKFFREAGEIGKIADASTEGYYTATATLDSSNASDKIDVMACSTDGTAFYIYAVGMYEYAA